MTPAARTLFTRLGGQAAGHEVFALGRPASQSFVLSTANSIFRRATALRDADPFDPHFGQCGGEDLHLLCRLARDGRRFGWLPEARATDFVPRHRVGTGYLVRRHFAGGQAYAATLIRTSPTPLRDEVIMAAKSLVQIGLLPLMGLAMLRREAPGRSFAIRAAGIVGKLLWRRLYPLYRTEAARCEDLKARAAGLEWVTRNHPRAKTLLTLSIIPTARRPVVLTQHKRARVTEKSIRALGPPG